MTSDQCIYKATNTHKLHEFECIGYSEGGCQSKKEVSFVHIMHVVFMLYI